MVKGSHVLFSFILCGITYFSFTAKATVQPGPPVQDPGGGPGNASIISSPAAGSDMWIALAGQKQLFTPH